MELEAVFVMFIEWEGDGYGPEQFKTDVALTRALLGDRPVWVGMTDEGPYISTSPDVRIAQDCYCTRAGTWTLKDVPSSALREISAQDGWTRYIHVSAWAAEVETNMFEEPDGDPPHQRSECKGFCEAHLTTLTRKTIVPMEKCQKCGAWAAVNCTTDGCPYQGTKEPGR